MKNLFLKIGTFRKAVSDVMFGTELNLNKWVKSLLTYINVPFYDDCCPTVAKPVRYNDGDLEQFNGSNWQIIDTPPVGSRYYGSFYSMQSQPGGSIRAFEFDNTDFSNDVSIQNDSEITFQHLGKYNIAFSAQLVKTGGTATEIWIWMRHQGVDVPNTATVVEMGNNNVYNVAAWNFFIDVDTSPQQFELMWYTPSHNVSISAIDDATTPAGVPGVPSIILTVNQVD